MNRTPLASHPAWVDLRTRAGTKTAARFYCGLFGWSVVAHHRPLDDRVGYWTFRQDGKDVGGLTPGREASWTVYISVADVDAMAQTVADHGGKVLAGPTTIADVGRTALCADPLGASFALWQPGLVARSSVTPRLGSTPSYQFACRDVEAAKRFYGSVFGWEARTTSGTEGATYTELFDPGCDRCVAGMVEMDSWWDDDVPSHWMTHFAVPDTDRVVARAAELGADVSVAPFDLPDVGRIAVLSDPERTTFSVLQAA